MNPLAADTTSTGALNVIARISAVTEGTASSPPKAAAQSSTNLEYAETIKQICQALATGDALAARQQLLDALTRQFGVTTAALGWQRSGEQRCSTALSGTQKIDRHSEQERMLQAACAETWLQSRVLFWTSDGAATVPPTYRQLGELQKASYVFGVPLAAAGLPVVLLFWGDGQPPAKLADAAYWNAIRGPLAGLASILDVATPSRFSKGIKQLTTLICGNRWLALIASLALCGVAMIPVPDRIACPATLEPQVRRYVVAPFDGTLEKSLVRTGDQVTAGQVLARLDLRPLKMELSVLQGERDEAGKRRDVARAKGQAALTQMAELETEQINGKIAHLQHQLDQLAVTSPINGVIVRGELERVEGAPLARGNSMFEIAPLTNLVAELAIPEDEVRLVAAGQQVTLWPAAQQGRKLVGTIERVHPRAEVRDGKSVFIADVVLNNEAGQLRPGMHAQAVVWSAAKPLGWTLIRRPYQRLTRWMWW